MVGAEVEHERVGGELRRDGARGTVREAEDHDVVPGENGRLRRQEHPVGERAQVGVVDAERIAGVAVRRHGADLHLGMGQKEAQRLTTRIAAGTRHGDSYSHSNNYTHGSVADR